MPDRTPIPLVPQQITLDSDDFAMLAGWPYADSFVLRLLQTDVPLRVHYGNCRIWAYRDPDGQFVGFSSLDLCFDYASRVNNRPHGYIPLLAINPTIKSLGYGTTIVQHLIEEATILAAQSSNCADVLILDVYTTSTKAIALYQGLGFTLLHDELFQDPDEGGKEYLVMGRQVTLPE